MQAISINGSRPESNSYLLDGILNTDQTVNVPSNILSIDAIQEFKVLSETYSAQYGLGANQISVVSKSGTNQFHGALFEFLRNDAFDAKNYFQSGSNAKLRQNQFGFVFDGPVRIPWLYNGRDKTFFMANYEGQRVERGGGDGLHDRTHSGRIGGMFLHLGHRSYDGAAISRRRRLCFPDSGCALFAIGECDHRPGVHPRRQLFRLRTGMPRTIIRTLRPTP